VKRESTNGKVGYERGKSRKEKLVDSSFVSPCETSWANVRKWPGGGSRDADFAGAVEGVALGQIDRGGFERGP